jgi:transcriptional regulator with XRE-family HTH domain
MSIPLRIKELRVNENLSKKAFAISIGMDNSQYGKIESGKITPTIKQLLDISSKYNASLDWILTGEGHMLRSEAYTKSEVIKDCQLCREKDKVITAQKETISLLKDKAENLNFRMREIEDKYYTPVAAESKLKYKHTKK